MWRLYFCAVLINLIPAFLDVLRSPDRVAAYHRVFEAHRPVFSAYWRNYVMDPESAAAEALLARALAADRSDLEALVAQVDVAALAEDGLRRAAEHLKPDAFVDCYLMVGMGQANAGELVIGGRGIVFICVEHFTGRPNPETMGLGLDPALIPMWVAHEVAHVVRYTGLHSRSELKRLVAEAGGHYDFWDTGRRATLRELLLNEGLAVHAAQAAAPGHERHTYFGYTRRQYQRLRESEAFLRRAVARDLDRAALGLRLRWLSDGMSPAARLVGGRVLPERSGYYLGARMSEALVGSVGIAEALRAAPAEFEAAERKARGIETA